MRDPCYFIRREECWGGTHVYSVWEDVSGRWCRASKKHFPSEKSAKVLCDRMNADYERYLGAMLERAQDNGV